jgi:hypothetical protein
LRGRWASRPPQPPAHVTARARARLRLCLAALQARDLGETLVQVDDLDAARFLGRQSLLALMDLEPEDSGKAVMPTVPSADAA